MTGKQFNLALLDNESPGIHSDMKYQSLAFSALILAMTLTALAGWAYTVDVIRGEVWVEYLH